MKAETLTLGLDGASPGRIYDAFWRFASERQQIFFKRAAGIPAPWTNDPVLREYRFTNAYRASDRVSQYLIREVIYQGSQDAQEIVFRVLLFKFFNKIETWELLNSQLGFPEYKKFRRDNYLKVLENAIAQKAALYSPAYIMAPPSGPYVQFRKHEAHLRLIESMMKAGLTAQLQHGTSMRECFDKLSSYPMIGDFLGYQLVTDLNYSEVVNFDEMSFVVAGPGARSGIAKCFGPTVRDYERVIREVAERQDREFKIRGLEFLKLGDRALQLIDVQNLFCEIDKYSRAKFPEARGIGDRTRIKRKFAEGTQLPALWFPPKWKINAKVASAAEAYRSTFRSDGTRQIKEATMGAEYRLTQVNAKRTIDLDALQRAQADHDKISHADILALSVQDRLKHFVLHFAKYVGALVVQEGKGEESPLRKRVVIDSFIICLAAANTLRIRLSERIDTSQWTRGGSAESIKDMAVVTGRMAKACEAMDHLEKFDFRGELEKGTAEMAAIVLNLHDDHQVFQAELQNRWRQVEGARVGY